MGDGGGIARDNAALTLGDVALWSATGFDTPSGAQFNTAGGSGGGIFNAKAATGCVTLQGTSSVVDNTPNNCAGATITGCTG